MFEILDFDSTYANMIHQGLSKIFPDKSIQKVKRTYKIRQVGNLTWQEPVKTEIIK